MRGLYRHGGGWVFWQAGRKGTRMNERGTFADMAVAPASGRRAFHGLNDGFGVRSRFAGWQGTADIRHEPTGSRMNQK